MKRLTKDQVLDMLRRKQGKRTQRDFADELGVSQQYLNDVLQGRREPGAAVIEPLGLRRIVYYEEYAEGV